MPYREGKKWRATPKFKGIRGRTKWCGTKKEALEWERQEKDRLKKIELRRLKGMDLLTLTGKYLDHSTRHSLKTYQEKRAVCKRVLKVWGKDVLVDEITTAMAETYLLKQKTKRSANASNKDRKNLLRMFNYGIQIHGLPSNPFAKTEKFPHDRDPQYTPPPEDVLRLLAVCTRLERTFLNAYLQTGARRSEIFRWLWHEDINFERRQVRIGTRKTKDGSMQFRWLGMSDELYESLWWLWNNRKSKHSPFVFVCETKGVHYGKPYKYRQYFIKNLCERAGIKPFGYHALRRFVASLLDDKKVSLKQIQMILGHEKPSTTDRYLFNLRGDIGMRETMNLLSIEVEKTPKNEKVHIYGTHYKKDKGSE